jgi:hypothetical protein
MDEKELTAEHAEEQFCLTMIHAVPLLLGVLRVSGGERLSSFRLHQQAGYVIVLRGCADEEIEIGHEAVE